MYASKTATREFALKAAAAADRAMERHACCKSQFKFKCFSCGEMINRGDKITHCNRNPTGMTLRYRGAGTECGLTMDEITFYQGTTGKDMWVHVGCIPCYWDSLPKDSNEYSRPKLRPICTDWGVKIYGEWEEWVEGDENWELMGLPYFRMVKGYPEEKLMFDRIVHAVKRFQAIWRGYIYKKAYPIALNAARATEAINLNARATMSSKQEEHDIFHPSREAEFWEQWKKSALATSWARSARWENWLQSEKGGGDPDEPVIPFNVREREAIEQREAQWRTVTGDLIGDHYEGLFNCGEPTEAIYSGQIHEIQYRGDWVKIKVKFHYDGEIRTYTENKFKLLKKEAEDFKRKMGIEAKIIGRLATRKLYPPSMAMR